MPFRLVCHTSEELRPSRLCSYIAGFPHPSPCIAYIFQGKETHTQNDKENQGNTIYALRRKSHACKSALPKSVNGDVCQGLDYISFGSPDSTLCSKELIMLIYAKFHKQLEVIYVYGMKYESAGLTLQHSLNTMPLWGWIHNHYFDSSSRL